MVENKHIAIRSTRLEAHLLDKELNDTFEGIVDQLEIPRYGEELKTIIKLYLFANYLKSNATAGMKVFGLNYCDTIALGDSAAYENRPKQKLIILTAFNLIGSYIARRYQKLEKILRNTRLKSLNLPWLNIDNTSLIYKSLNVLNFLVFLRCGTYLTMPERILGLAPVITDESEFYNAQLNKVQMDYLYRETILRAISEFLTTIIPLVNFEQLKNRLSKLVGLMPKLESHMKLSEKIQQESNATRCAICLKQPFNPYIIGCRHVFCYYCLQARHLTDPSLGFVCLQCKYSTQDSSQVERFKVLREI